MNDLEIKTLEDILDEVAALAPASRADAIRKIRENVLAIKLTQRLPAARPPWWQNTQLWYAVLVLAAMLASLAGIEIPITKLFGGN